MSSQDGVRGQEGADGLLDVRHLGVDSIQHLGRDSRELGQVVSHNIGGSEMSQQVFIDHLIKFLLFTLLKMCFQSSVRRIGWDFENSEAKSAKKAS